ncbi:MAG: Germination protease [Firmicutes bacterium]|nr:Germination protease [Bacillota bacterium]
MTGIETGEIIVGIVDKVKPDLVIAVDALASRSVERVGTTVQEAIMALDAKRVRPPR